MYYYIRISSRSELQKNEPKRLKRLSRAQNPTPRGDVELRAAAEVAARL
jgi:hypothetical protein